MSGGDAVGAERDRMVEERTKLDFAVAQYVGIGRAAAFVLAEEASENALAILAREVDHFDLDPDHVANAPGIDQVLARRAALGGIVVPPCLPQDPGDLATFPLAHPSRGPR